MAPPRVSENPEVDAHYATQVALTAALFAALRRLWPTLKPQSLRETFSDFTRGSAAVAGQFSQAAISLNADYYEAMREQAGVTSRFTAPMIDPLGQEQIEAYIRTATADLLEPSASLLADLDALTTTIQEKTDAALQKVVMDAGRNELIEAIEGDREAKGWARVTKPGACSFCLMMASRGPVYISAGSGGLLANKRFTGDGKFKFHNNCHCTLEPLFAKHYEAPAQVRDAHALWNDSTGGLGGKDARNAFRRAVDAQRRAQTTR